LLLHAIGLADSCSSLWDRTFCKTLQQDICAILQSDTIELNVLYPAPYALVSSEKAFFYITIESPLNRDEATLLQVEEEGDVMFRQPMKTQSIIHFPHLVPRLYQFRLSLLSEADGTVLDSADVSFHVGVSGLRSFLIGLN
jgi:hypothetical protein